MANRGTLCTASELQALLPQRPASEAVRHASADVGISLISLRRAWCGSVRPRVPEPMAMNDPESVVQFRAGGVSSTGVMAVYDLIPGHPMPYYQRAPGYRTSASAPCVGYPTSSDIGLTST